MRGRGVQHLKEKFRVDLSEVNLSKDLKDVSEARVLRGTTVKAQRRQHV